MDADERSGEHSDVLDVELCLRYQTELAGKINPGRSGGSADAIMKTFGPIVGGIVKEHHDAHIPGDSQDLLGEMYITLLEAARDFDPARGVPFRPWLRQRLDRCRLRFIAGQNLTSMSKSRDRVVRIYHKTVTELQQQLQRTPTTNEVSAGVEEWVRNWAYERLRDAGAISDTLTKAEVDELVEAKLRKQGTIAAMRELGLAVQARTTTQSLDSDETGRPLLDIRANETAADPAQQFEDAGEHPILGMFTDEERTSLFLFEGMADGERHSYRDIADRLDIPWTMVRRLVVRAKAKATAPHAHYVYLSGSIRNQFEAVAGSPVERLRTRVEVQ